MIEKVETGIPGLDEMLEGGFPKGYTILISGGPGTGKSTLGMQFLVNGVARGEDGIYVTFEERPRDIIRNFSQYGWDLNSVFIIGILTKKSSFVPPANYVDEIKQGDNYREYIPKNFSIDLMRDVLIEEVKKRNAKRIVIDSLPALALHFESDKRIREEILGLINLLAELECTSLILTEMPTGGGGVSRFGIEEFLVHGVITLYNIRKGSERVRGLEILKMRGTRHSKKICLMEIGDSGIVVYPNENLYSEEY